MSRAFSIAAAFTAALVSTAPGPLGGKVPPPDLVDRVQEELRNRIEAAAGSGRLVAGGGQIHATGLLPGFYERRVYAPAWSDADGPLPRAHTLVRALRAASEEGLRPADYHLRAIEALLGTATNRETIWSVPRLVALDLLLTDAFLLYGSHLLSGRVDPVSLDPQWLANRREADLSRVLESALASGRVDRALAELLPAHPGYRQLRSALARYRVVEEGGGWPTVSAGPKLGPGDSGPRVAQLHERLAGGGDLASAAVGETYDEAVEAAVQRFQRRHGLDPDGVVGPATLAALNVSAAERVRTIELNMERWRWLPQELGRRYILVNIANFELDVVEAGTTVLSMRVVVGRPYRRTPVFSDTMTYVVLNPYWHVPRNLAIQDVLPRIQRDPNYLTTQNFQLFRVTGGTLEAVNPAMIDWSRVSAADFPYRLRQEPGPANALGRVKLMFPNRFNVYLHDTPSRELFARTARDFSSGCIRLEHPLQLTEYVLRGNPEWRRERIEQALRTASDQTVRLPEKIPVHLLYWTAWAEEGGVIHFRRDIYDRDPGLGSALDRRPPGP